MREHVQIRPSPGEADSPGAVARRLGGAGVLRQADHTVAVLAAARDLPSGIPLSSGDLRPVRVRLPAPQLAGYARPGNDILGSRLASSLPKDALIPLAFIHRG